MRIHAVKTGDEREIVFGWFDLPDVTRREVHDGVKAVFAGILAATRFSFGSTPMTKLDRVFASGIEMFDKTDRVAGALYATA